MSEDATQPRQVQRVNMSAKGEVVIPESDDRVANLIRMGLTEVEAREAVRAVGNSG